MGSTQNRGGSLEKATHELVAQLISTGRYAEAQLTSAALLEANPRNKQAWLFLARTLVLTGHPREASYAFYELSRAYASIADLPMAIVAALECEKSGGNTTPVLAKLAESFSCSAQGLVDDWKPLPPALPGEVTVDLRQAHNASFLMKASQSALANARRTLDLEERCERRFFPLFSSLTPVAFIHFARSLCIESRELGDVVIEQGNLGKAFFIVAQGEVRVNRRNSEGKSIQLARLGPGAFFGEMAIVARIPRAASVICATNTILLRANISTLSAATSAVPELHEVLRAFCRARMLENVISASAVLKRVPVKERSALLRHFSETSHRAGDVIITEGSKSKGLFLLVSGEVGISKRDSGDILSITKLSAGEIFGEISLVLRQPALATVTALSDTVCLLLPHQSFLETVESYPELLAELYQTALKRQEETTTILAREAENADDLILL